MSMQCHLKLYYPYRAPQMMAPDNSSKPNIPAIPRSQAVKQYIEPSYSTLLQLQNDMAPGRQHKKLQQLQTLRESKYISQCFPTFEGYGATANKIEVKLTTFKFLMWSYLWDSTFYGLYFISITHIDGSLVTYKA